MLMGIVFAVWIAMAMWLVLGKPNYILYDKCWCFLTGLTIGLIMML